MMQTLEVCQIHDGRLRFDQPDLPRGSIFDLPFEMLNLASICREVTTRRLCELTTLLPARGDRERFDFPVASAMSRLSQSKIGGSADSETLK